LYTLLNEYLIIQNYLAIIKHKKALTTAG